MIEKLNPTIYRKDIWYNKHSKPMVYVQLKKPYVGHCRQLYYSGNYYQKHYRSGVLY